MKRLFFIVIFIVLSISSTVFSEGPYDSLDFEDFDCTNIPQNIDCLPGDWYINYIGMEYIYENNINLYPNFTVAILDSAISNHEDINQNLIRDISNGDDNNIIPYMYIPQDGMKGHGTATTSVFSGGIIGNFVGGRGIINANTIFLSALSRVEYNNEYKDIGYNTDTIIIGLQKLLNPSVFSISLGFYRPKIVNLSVGIAPSTEIGRRRCNFNQGEHYYETQKIRNFIAQNSDVLFVLTAGNESTDSKKDNGAIHYQYNSVRGLQKVQDNLIYNWIINYDPEKDETNYDYIPLENAIIVAANDPEERLHGYSNYGESVDITAPSSIFTASCICSENNQNTYNMYHGDEGIRNSNEMWEYYGYSFYSQDYSLLEDETDNEDYQDINISCDEIQFIAQGTSFSTPIVAGAAGLLLSKDENLTPSEIKRYLNQASGLQKAYYRHNTPIDQLTNTNLQRNDLVPINLIAINGIPVLNIETSMKWYEEEKYYEDIMLQLIQTFTNKINWAYNLWLNTTTYARSTDGLKAKFVYNGEVISVYYYSGYPYLMNKKINGILHQFFPEFGDNYLEFNVITTWIYEYTNIYNGEILQYNSMTGEILHLSSSGEIL